MGALLAFAAGYVLGARAGREELEEVTSAFWEVVRSEEVADLVGAARAHLGHTLREVAGMVDGVGSGRVGRHERAATPGPGTADPGTADDDGDLVERVRRLVSEG